MDLLQAEAAGSASIGAAVLRRIRRGVARGGGAERFEARARRAAGGRVTRWCRIAPLPTVWFSRTPPAPFAGSRPPAPSRRLAAEISPSEERGQETCRPPARSLRGSPATRVSRPFVGFTAGTYTRCCRAARLPRVDAGGDGRGVHARHRRKDGVMGVEDDAPRCPSRTRRGMSLGVTVVRPEAVDDDDQVGPRAGGESARTVAKDERGDSGDRDPSTERPTIRSPGSHAARLSV